MHKCCRVAVLLPGSLALLLWSVTALVPPLDAGLPVVRISAPSAVATESGTSNGLVTISRSGPIPPGDAGLVVEYTISGSAGNGKDFYRLPGRGGGGGGG